MSLKHIDIESSLRRLAEKRIEDAMREGKFDNLEGAGKPLELEPIPAEENARLMWWALRLLRQNDVIPEEVRWRKEVAILKLELSHTLDESRVRELVASINSLVRRLNTLGTNAIAIAVTGIDEEEELAHLHRRRARRDANSSNRAS